MLPEKVHKEIEKLLHEYDISQGEELEKQIIKQKSFLRYALLKLANEIYFMGREDGYKDGYERGIQERF